LDGNLLPACSSCPLAANLELPARSPRARLLDEKCRPSREIARRRSRWTITTTSPDSDARRRADDVVARFFSSLCARVFDGFALA